MMAADYVGEEGRAAFVGAGRLRNKTALVTGGTSGIGAEIVSRFLREGAHVAFVGRKPEPGAGMAQRLGPRAHFIQADVTDESQIAEAVSKTCRWRGRLDILVNNAGGLTGGGVSTFSREDYTAGLDLVLGSVLFGMKHASHAMVGQGWGAIINNSSVAGIRTQLGGYLYSVAKAAVTHATRLAGMELGAHGVTVNCISPGSVATPIYLGGSAAASRLPQDKVRDIMEGLPSKLAHTTPMMRAGLPTDIAAAAVFLASDEGHFINCHDLVVDGGITASARAEFEARALQSP